MSIESDFCLVEVTHVKQHGFKTSLRYIRNADKRLTDIKKNNTE